MTLKRRIWINSVSWRLFKINLFQSNITFFDNTFYFVVETKAKDESALVTGERLKMECGEHHFKVLVIQYKIIKEISQLDNLLSNG